MYCRVREKHSILTEILLDKDHQMPIGKTKNKRTPSLCKKGLVACRDTALGVFCHYGVPKAIRQYH